MRKPWRQDMKSDDEIRIAQESAMSRHRQHPENSHSTIHAEAVVTDGLACTVRQGGQEVQLDMPDSVGGGATAPSHPA